MVLGIMKVFHVFLPLISLKMSAPVSYTHLVYSLAAETQLAGGSQVSEQSASNILVILPRFKGSGADNGRQYHAGIIIAVKSALPDSITNTP